MYAIIETGGKQYKVSENDVIFIEKLGLEDGENYTFENVLVLSDNDNIKFGDPYVAGASVKGTVLLEGKAKKVIVYKYKPKKGYHKKKGHRQPFTKIKIDSISS